MWGQTHTVVVRSLFLYRNSLPNNKAAIEAKRIITWNQLPNPLVCMSAVNYQKIMYFTSPLHPRA